MDRNYHVTTLFQNADILRRPGVAKFADIAKIVIKLTRKIKLNKSQKNHKLCIKIKFLSFFTRYNQNC